MKVAKGATLELRCGGGGGYGPPAKRERQSVLDDLREGYVTRPTRASITPTRSTRSASARLRSKRED